MHKDKLFHQKPKYQRSKINILQQSCLRMKDKIQIGYKRKLIELDMEESKTTRKK